MSDRDPYDDDTAAREPRDETVAGGSSDETMARETRADETVERDRHDDESVARGSHADERAIRRNPREAGKWASLVIAVLGLWLVVEPFLFDVVAGNFWNDVVIGVALLAIGGYNYYRRADERLASVGAAALAALLGLWLVLSPWVYGAGLGEAGTATDFGFWNDVIVGLLVLLLGAYSAYEARDRDVGAVAAE